ncbi:MMPL family transporter [Candidatus Woesearchaeota archaeon]|nr:MMPL family transporter [Candidatus Woesearchaeota archaeon]
MGKFKRILTNWRVIMLVIAIILSLVAISPQPWADGVVIKSVERNSSASLAGIENPKPTAQPLSKERVLTINNQPLHSVADYYAALENVRVNQTLQVKTNKRVYQVKIQPEIRVITLNETEPRIVQEIIQVNETINGTTLLVNKTINKTIDVSKTLQEILGPKYIGLTVDEAPVTNLRKGLDLQGGTRVILKPAEQVSDETMGLLVDSLSQRLNVFGLSDVVITTVGGAFAGEEGKLILIEIAGATAQEVSDLVKQQGKFEAKVGEATVFKGGSNDITYVCRTAECSGIDPNRGCGQVSGGWSCGFRFSIALSPEAAERQAEATRTLDVTGTGQDRYLAEPLNLYLDDELVRSLNIAADLKGRAVTDISITGSGSGISQQEALTNTFTEMKTLQTVLITGSLPVKLDVVKIDTISPVLGKAFINNAILLALISAAAVAIVLTIVYRKLRVAIPIILTAVFEVTIVLGIAAVIRWNLDLASIAGIIIAIGTGVNDQIIITDEAFRKEAQGSTSWKERIKRAFGVVFAAYFTNMVAMVALWFFGAGLLKGFAVTSILAITAGVLITRPAYAAIVNLLTEE